VPEGYSREHGLVATSQRSIRLEAGARGADVMVGLRANMPKDVAGVPVRVVVDLLEGTRSEAGGVTPVTLPTSNVVVFYLDDDSRIIVRPSGTEPKVKCYFEVREAMHNDDTLEEADARAQARLATLMDAFTL